MATTTYSDPESGSEEPEEEYGHGEESESDSEGEPTGFLDILAEVDDGESEGEEDSEDEGFAFTASASHLFRASTTAASLEPFDFEDLPTEIRHRIWEWFCPELRARSRLLEFHLARGPSDVMDLDNPQVWILQDGITLNDSTKALRTLLAVCQESRELALAKVPHALEFDAGPNGDAIVRFNRDKDVIALNGPSMADLAQGDELLLGNFREEVKSFSLPGWEAKDEFDHDGLAYLIRQFLQVDSVFGCMSSGDCRKNQLGWCKSDLVNRQYIQTFEKEPGLGEDLEFYFCWADQRNHPDFAKFQIPSELVGTVPRPIAQACQEKNVTMYPMVVFELESGIRKYNSLPQFNSAEFNNDDDDDDDESEEESEEGSDLDEYESDGIDDDPIPELGSDEDDEISIDGEEVGQSATQHFEARFSSPEPDPVSRRRKRTHELDSDDSGEADADAPVVKRVRRNQVIDSDDEDEGDGVEPVKEVVVIDDEEEGEDEDGEEDQGDDDEDESESETEEEPRQLSLAERLNAHRRNNPVEDDEESNDEEDDDQDDDEEGDDSEPQSENELLDAMAEESGDEDELPEDPFYDPI